MQTEEEEADDQGSQEGVGGVHGDDAGETGHQQHQLQQVGGVTSARQNESKTVWQDDLHYCASDSKLYSVL